ncbi:efflux RND transporter periplasmic adaptor subunit [Burkholderia territorii]|uniref:efflux RND transporter periplasmic adaptor subunit n=1 Tax=Burkholderia territorii TaxID=1503055 RepID=UPI00075E60B9|nr:efflux RND transporter periplasmic adaptor subunit [Burkholderia territorii]KWE39814.1 RND transporter MFP subunit [Burkholderia territorii]KWE43392.1 RND transporter MFP subunit [Burkholderia territorii]KWE49043.1 RND transporter MFP subunit [Burkholderia territorii]
MTKQSLARTALLTFAGAALLGAGYVAGMRQASGGAQTMAAMPDSQAQRKVLYWHDPMVPNQHFDKPGKSPFMDMQLQPVYADEAGGATGIRIDPGLQQNLGIRYAVVRRQQTADGFDAVATTQFDESRADVVQSRVTGYIDRLYARTPMQRIEKGAPIASLFVPEWLAPQEEYLALKRGGMDGTLLDASRARMRALSMPDAMIAALDRTGHAQTHVVLSAPETGVVSELNVRDGAMVAPGQTLAKIAGLSTLWLIVEVPEALALNVQPGMSVDATFTGDPARHFTGRIRDVLPGINAGSRTLQARVAIDNAALELTPGMLMRVRVAAHKTVSRLLVPSEAVIATGTRSIVIVKTGDGRLQPVSVTAGNDTGGDTEVLDGLHEGDTVVASGQFLIDSEASLKSVLPRLERAAGAGATAASAPVAASVYETTGKVEKVTDDDITFSHQPVPALGWGAMTMAFGKPSAHAFADVKAGQTVRFAFTQTDDGYRLTKVEPQGGAR